MPTSRQIIGPLALSVAALAGCEFRVPSPFYIAGPTLISITTEVVELGPLNPDRVGVPYPAPIAEVMPGDRVALEAVIVDADGHQLVDDEVDSVWLQCGQTSCSSASILNPVIPSELPDCATLDPLTLDDPCRIAAGDHHAEFVVPELGPLVVDSRVVNYYGIIGYAGRTAQTCIELLEARDARLERCAFVIRPIKIGPSWWLLAYAETLGFTPAIPIWQIPAAVFGQPANRVPNLSFDVWVNDALVGTWPDTDTFAVAPGDRITVESRYDMLEQFLQTYFVATLHDEDTYWFQPAQEFLSDSKYATQSIHAVDDDNYIGPREWIVDPYAEPGSAQVFVVFSDDRNGEGWARLEFEVGR